jgi:hypothetical protein
MLPRKSILLTDLCCRLTEHEEKYDGRTEELKLDTETSFLPVLSSDEVDWVAS